MTYGYENEDCYKYIYLAAKGEDPPIPIGEDKRLLSDAVAWVKKMVSRQMTIKEFNAADISEWQIETRQGEIQYTEPNFADPVSHQGEYLALLFLADPEPYAISPPKIENSLVPYRFWAFLAHDSFENMLSWDDDIGEVIEFPLD
ncbi:hypothetical protein [Picosynechococcus sp. PCC 8807]|uniref:hypothetical protein n=1 Tax=Picosynechococcus sp. PCC 8807 TaxID=195248 RepID=UPI0008103269|nr:hypothetical protein [Picosynechococcus sp. PCC 8807]ANV89224.1 hypothetical protein AWQ24_00375 [Picosynechococcus sp. PCC 8807]ANV90669.1 hypothetical protein AWQ24_08530 [Picosynechococcus sp. PCC 8807]